MKGITGHMPQTQAPSTARPDVIRRPEMQSHPRAPHETLTAILSSGDQLGIHAAVATLNAIAKHACLR